MTLSSVDVGTGTPNNLPRPSTSFVGRERAVEDCLRFLRSARLLTVTGVGGSGKTRLALRVAQQLLPEYAGGIWFVDLAPLADPGRLPDALASAVGISEESGRPIRETIARHLARRRTLLVLDNCEHVLAASATLAVFLLESVASLRVIATSRERLGVLGEQTYPVPSLSLPEGGEAADLAEASESEAVRLFAERATQVNSSFVLDQENAPIVVEICRRLDGIPLAIELAAARARMLAVGEIRAKLHDRFRLLSGRAGTLPRHQTLRAAMQWSYDHLTADEQAMLRALSVFVGGWTLEAAVGVCGQGRDEFEVLDLLTGLVDKSLIVVEPSGDEGARYRFLETMRQYAEDLHDEHGERPAARRVHAEWFVAWAERGEKHLTGPDQAAWLDRMDREGGNLRSALGTCLEEERIELAVRMAAAVQWWWMIRGYVREARERLETIVARAHSFAPTATLASVLQATGNACYRLDDFDAASAHYQRALEMRERMGDLRGAAGSLGALGNVAQYQGRYDDALDLFQRSLAINRESGNKVWEAANLNCLGNCSRAMKRHEASRAYLEQAVALNREIGNRNGESFSLDGLGCLMLDMGNHAAARTLLDQALAIERELGNEHEQAVTLASLARLALKEGNPSQARADYVAAIGLSHRLGAVYQAAEYVHALAGILASESQERAVRLWSFAETFRRSVGARVDPDFDPAETRVAAAREALGPPGFDAAWAEGSRLSLDQAVELAIGGA